MWEQPRANDPAEQAEIHMIICKCLRIFMAAVLMRKRPFKAKVMNVSLES